MIWHSAASDEVLQELGVDPQNGLPNGVAEERLEFNGKNVISNAESVSFVKHFLGLLTNKLSLLIFVVAVFSLVVSYVYKDTNPAAFYTPLLIIAMVLLSTLFEALHRYSGERIMNHLHTVTKPEATVLRDGVVRKIPASLLVQGDIILLNAGDYITADARLLETTALRCNETRLTEENVPIEKNADFICEDITPIEQRCNMIYAGSNVIQGTAKAVVTATGLHTELGHTTVLTQQCGTEKLPLQKMLDSSYRIINFAIAVICILYFVLGIVLHFSEKPFAEMTVRHLTDSFVLAYTAVPAGLAVVSSVMIAMGIERIYRDNILIKKAGAAELLGRTTVLCIDKTGILTHKSMSLSSIYDGTVLTELNDESVLSDKEGLILKLAAACSTLDGDATETAIAQSCERYNFMSLVDIEGLFPRINTIAFDAERKIMTTINLMNGKPFAISKGAPEMLVRKCVNCDCEAILKQNDALAELGLRMICIAMRPLTEIPAAPVAEEIERDMMFVGLLGFSDPPRNTAIEALKICDQAGIRSIMITGDHPTTARAVARRIGILKDGTELLTGSQLEALSDDELQRDIEKYSVYARITPADKVRIIKAWQGHRELVTTTGDGAEDADALATADIGCAIGQNGSDVARGSADIVITDNSFASIVDAIRESRGLFENIRKSVFYLLTCNFSVLLVFLLGMLIFHTAPLPAVQLLWLNLLIDGAPFIALGFEKAEDHVMHRKPLSLSGHIFDRYSCFSGALHTVFIAAITLIVYSLKAPGSALSQTMTFTVLGLSQLIHVYNLKTTGSVFSHLSDLFTTNHFMNMATGLALFIILFLVFTPVGFAFGLTILPFGDFLICLALALSLLPFGELVKLLIHVLRKQ